MGNELSTICFIPRRHTFNSATMSSISRHFFGDFLYKKYSFNSMSSTVEKYVFFYLLKQALGNGIGTKTQQSKAWILQDALLVLQQQYSITAKSYYLCLPIRNAHMTHGNLKTLEQSFCIGLLELPETCFSDGLSY